MSVKAHIGVQGTRSDRGILFDVLAPASVAELLRDGGDVARSVTPATLEAMRTQGPHVQTEDAAIVRALLEAGVVIIAKVRPPPPLLTSQHPLTPRRRQCRRQSCRSTHARTCTA
jgi:hypothetical protein